MKKRCCAIDSVFGSLLTLVCVAAIVAPLSPGLYLQPKSVNDLVDFMAGRLLDLLGVEHQLPIRWDEHLAEQRQATANRHSTPR